MHKESAGEGYIFIHIQDVELLHKVSQPGQGAQCALKAIGSAIVEKLDGGVECDAAAGEPVCACESTCPEYLVTPIIPEIFLPPTCVDDVFAHLERDAPLVRIWLWRRVHGARGVDPEMQTREEDGSGVGSEMSEARTVNVL